MFKSLMVSVDSSNALASRVRLAVDLAKRYNARLIGAGAHNFISFPADGLSAQAVEDLEREGLQQRLDEAEARFRRLATGNVSCRFDIRAPAIHLAQQARAADLLIVGAGTADYSPMSPDAGDVVMTAGRPVLVVPQNTDHLVAKRIVIAWKDSRECRRSVQDGLPFLTLADEIWVASIGSPLDEEGAKDVAEYLNFRGVNTHVFSRPDAANGVTEELFGLAERSSADLIVAGAYGHSRTREWIFGGVTQDLLDKSPVPCLLAH
ncbi:universal stress protein [Roseiarcaceae bacterium H3SJ34-1]|uniref:universal stress protein n=1 Tax=Terripilifer ovatus TaxID=3032367 RepID=UPI003AB9A35F|nr:universal stress protein [Roseiarcaceae bacterium H3SJ34-1]